MFEEILATQNPHWRGESYETGIPRTCFRQLLDYISTGQIIAVTGVRRAGKSTLLKQLINDLIDNQGVSARSILFLNLEHPYLSRYRDDGTILQRLYEDYLKLNGQEGEVYLLLDEVQFFREWPIFVKAHHETKKVHFVVTGSNAMMLSSDLVTMLSGRSLPLEVFPFSFREIARGRGLDIDDSIFVAEQGPTLRRLLDELLEYGGFPLVALGNKSQTAFDILGAHARTVLLQDVVPRLGIRKPVDLEQLYVYLVSHIGKPFSYAGLSKLFGLSDKSIKEYVQALIDAHLIYEVDAFSYSLKHQIRSPKKIYSIDTGQANAMGFKFSSNHGRLLENLILVDLKRLGFQVYYFKTKTNREIDFFIKSRENVALVQVSWDLNDPDTYEREISALRDAKQEFPSLSATLIVAEPLLSPLPKEVGINILMAHQYLALKPEDRKRILY